jgi:glycosyltransferase involved in cell wall biosynthesis
MRIAYITPYQGPTVLDKRPIVENRSMSNRMKIELIARLLHQNGHEVEILSHGEVIDNRFRFYPGFWEPKLFHPGIPVYYISSLAIRRLNGFWAGRRAVQFLKKRHKFRPYDLVIIFNLKRPQISAARYAHKKLRVPVILEYEDDAFVDVTGNKTSGLVSRWLNYAYNQTIACTSGCMAVSPHLLGQLPTGIPRLLLRGVVGDDVAALGQQTKLTDRKNWVLFAGTHIESNGVKELITGWGIAELPGWELHITGGGGGMTEELRKMAANNSTIKFHGFVDRQELVQLLSSTKICINPHAVSQIPGNVFAFKIIEYLAAGAHVITTPMGALEDGIENGMSYMQDNKPETVARTLQQVIRDRAYERTAAEAASRGYGMEAVSKSLEALIDEVMAFQKTRGVNPAVTCLRTVDSSV